ncbi:MAG: Peptidase [Acidimicrobiales bacterium]|nr:Peptidase [Acidimicrobiales bacterium]
MAKLPPWSRSGRVATAVVLAGGLIGVVAGTPAGGAPANPRIPTQPPTQRQAVARAMDSVAAHRTELRATSKDAFVPHDTSIDPDGSTHVHLDRTYDGLPVLGGDVIVHNTPGGAFKEVTLTQPAPLTLSTVPKVTQATAVARAEQAFHGVKHASTAKLVVDQLGAKPALAWLVVVDGVAADQSPSHLNVVVDAQSGAQRRTWDTFQHADGTGNGFHVGQVTIGTSQGSGGYELKDPARGNGQTRDMQDRAANGPGVAITSANNVFGNGQLSDRATVGVDAHDGIQETWDYYKDHHGRNGIRNDGKGATSYVHYGKNYANAGWDDTCFCMIYGDGAPGSKPFTEIDVAGHEMSHGVTAATAGLVYSGEPGGLNEANSDIFGTLVEFEANSPKDTPDYLIGELINIRGNGTPLRWMDDPKKDGSSASCWSSSVGGLDVHHSSGVGNHFAYLLAVGSGQSQWGNSPTCNGAAAVKGVGNEKLGKIWYRALTTYMTSNTNYAAARTATLKAAQDLYGKGNECFQTNAAWAAVAVNGTDPGCTSGGGGGGDQTPVVANPGAQTATVGQPVNLRVSASDPQGDTLTYAASGLPAGLSIDPSSGVISGTPSSAGSVTTTVTARDPGGNTGSASFGWTVQASGGGGGSCTPGQVIKNGGFETGKAPWTATSGVITKAGKQQPAHGGSSIAWLSGYGTTRTDTLSQPVTIPAACKTARLSFFLHIDTKETGPTAYDELTVAVGNDTLATYSNVDATSGYQQRTLDLSAYAGKTVTVTFTGDEDRSLATSFVVDDAALNIG